MKVCTISDCTIKAYGHGLCNKHYQRQRRGQHLDHSRYEPNQVVIDGDVARITLYNWHNEPVSETLIDADQVPKVCAYRWGLCNGYVIGRANGKKVRLHRLVTGWLAHDDFHIDHIDGNPLNNRAANLRRVSATVNHGNKRKQRNNHSGFVGVYFDRSRNNWQSRVTHMGKNYYCGRFATAEEAAQAYNRMKISLYGSDTTLNMVNSK